VSGDPGRMLVTGDLHFRSRPPGDECTLELARFVCDSGADAFAIAGDVGETDPASYGACLDLFAGFGGAKLVVPGNHDLWTTDGDSLEKYRDVLPRIAAEHGFHALDTAPLTLGATAFIGSIGWYDYSFRNPDLPVPLAQYERKELPGVCVWNDGRFVHWDLTDAEFTDRCVRRLLRHYREVEGRVETVVAVLHHVAFRGLLYGPADAAHEFCRAYMGSERLGRLLEDCPKVRYVFCGHRHGPNDGRFGRIHAFNIGSEYLVKRLIDFDLRTGEHETHVFGPAREEGAQSQG